MFYEDSTSAQFPRWRTCQLSVTGNPIQDNHCFVVEWTCLVNWMDNFIVHCSAVFHIILTKRCRWLGLLTKCKSNCKVVAVSYLKWYRAVALRGLRETYKSRARLSNSIIIYLLHAVNSPLKLMSLNGISGERFTLRPNYNFITTVSTCTSLRK